MTVRELTQISASPLIIMGATTGKILKRNVTTETIKRNPKLGELRMLGMQTSLAIDTQCTCWVRETEFNAIK